MIKRKIETMEDWEKLRQELKDKGYTLCNFQYDTNHPEGFHAWFMLKDYMVEVVTHDPEVEKQIIIFNERKKGDSEK